MITVKCLSPIDIKNYKGDLLGEMTSEIDEISFKMRLHVRKYTTLGRVKDKWIILSKPNDNEKTDFVHTINIGNLINQNV